MPIALDASPRLAVLIGARRSYPIARSWRPRIETSGRGAPSRARRNGGNIKGMQETNQDQLSNLHLRKTRLLANDLQRNLAYPKATGAGSKASWRVCLVEGLWRSDTTQSLSQLIWRGISTPSFQTPSRRAPPSAAAKLAENAPNRTAVNQKRKVRGRPSDVVGVSPGLRNDLINAFLGVVGLMPVRAPISCAT